MGDQRSLRFIGLGFGAITAMVIFVAAIVVADHAGHGFEPAIAQANAEPAR